MLQCQNTTQYIGSFGCLHGRTGLEILGGGHEFARPAPKAREPLGGSGAMLPREILKYSRRRENL